VPQLTGVDRLLWALAFFGHCSLMTVLLVRRRATSFPAFTSLIGLNILRTVILYFVLGHATHLAYFYAYWVFGFTDMAIQLAIVYELAAHVFRPLGVWAKDVRQSFFIILPTSVIIAVALAWFAAPVTRTLRQNIVVRVDFFASALMGELFVAMVALSVTIGLPWRTHVARLAQGFGIYSIFGIIYDAALSQYVSGSTNEIFKQLSHIPMVIYLSCLSYWIVTLALPEPAARKMPEHLHQELVVLQDRVAKALHLLRNTGNHS
jgi:hypothetical protein